ncbi:MAG: NAD-dependent epimerase/dehydratase family protein [Candidatus Andersenbacteria bacterium]
MSKILITGGAGFIGAHVAKALMDKGEQVVLLDDMNGFLYPAKLKEDRITHLFTEDKRPRLIVGNILDDGILRTVFEEEKFDKVLHFAALANPGASIGVENEYAAVNIMGTINVLKMCRDFDITQLVFAGSSSVYNDEQTPFVEANYPLNPRSPYGASKAAAELYLQMWNSLYGLPVTVLRFFSVYGPWGRPDMAPMIFARQILQEATLQVTRDRQRDFTYIDDVVQGILSAVEKKLDFEIINLGRGEPQELTEFIAAIEAVAGKKVNIEFRDAPPGEMKVTYANIDKAKQLLGYQPKVSITEGTQKLIEWVQEYGLKQ